MLRLNMSVQGKKRSAVSISNASGPVVKLVQGLEHMQEWVQEIPPLTQPGRFGNKAFRSWHARLIAHAANIMGEVVAAAENESYAEAEGVSMENVAEELAEYLRTSFGNEMRIDYGSGHEAHFLVLLFCLDKVGVFSEEDDEDVVLLLFPEYLNTTRLLQTRYMLEPAGSHGVWGLDDYSFLPFLWGSSQLIGCTRITTNIVVDQQAMQEHTDEYLYLDAVGYIYEMKTGPFAEHSPTLYAISSVQGGWKKINQGMIKMYRGEVWEKRPVIQHFLFGSVFKFEKGSSKGNSK